MVTSQRICRFCGGRYSPGEYGLHDCDDGLGGARMVGWLVATAFLLTFWALVVWVIESAL